MKYIVLYSGFFFPNAILYRMVRHKQMSEGFPLTVGERAQSPTVLASSSSRLMRTHLFQ